MDETSIVWTDYMQYRLELRGFDRAAVEEIVRYSMERYVDTTTGRSVAVGRDGKRLVLVPYERSGDTLTPITVHPISCQLHTTHHNNPKNHCALAQDLRHPSTELRV